jgi:RNA polymerase sigma-70 factor (ECF subfamily)
MRFSHAPDEALAVKVEARRSPRPLRLVSDDPQASHEGRSRTDAELVEALRAGDTDAPNLLWERHSPAVKRLLARALGPSMDIDDLTQEVFLRVFVRLPVLRNPAALRAFTLSVAANVLKRELRRRWVSRWVILSGTGTLPDLEGESDDLEARQALRRCYAIFDTLAANERIAFILRYMEGMTADEVAATLSVSVRTAKRWVSRAAAKIAEKVALEPGLRHFFTVRGDRDTHAP